MIRKENIEEMLKVIGYVRNGHRWRSGIFILVSGTKL